MESFSLCALYPATPPATKPAELPTAPPALAPTAAPTGIERPKVKNAAGNAHA